MECLYVIKLWLKLRFDMSIWSDLNTAAGYMSTFISTCCINWSKKNGLFVRA